MGTVSHHPDPAAGAQERDDNARLVFTEGMCPLGAALVVASGAGVCRLALGVTLGALRHYRGHHWPEAVPMDATRSGDHEALALAWAALAQPERPPQQLPPLDLSGTPFQHLVWTQLRRVPHGATVTYAELARRLGRPRAARAVAGACARNPVAVLVPCHRVVRANGTPGGYRWGLPLKRELLALEARGPGDKPEACRRRNTE